VFKTFQKTSSHSSKTHQKYEIPTAESWKCPLTDDPPHNIFGDTKKNCTCEGFFCISSASLNLQHDGGLPSGKLT